MDLVTRRDLDVLTRLDEPGDGPRVSMFMPTARVGSRDRTDALRWKNLVTGVESALTDRGAGRREVDALLAPAHELLEDALAWQHMSDGLAMFLRPGWHRSYRVPLTLPEVATAGDRFVVGPLVRLLARDAHFLVLALSQRHVRLLEGTAQLVEEVELRDVATDLREIMAEAEPRSDTMARPLTAGGRAVFYGRGGGGEGSHKQDVAVFLRRVADGLRSHLTGQDLPLVLVGLTELVSLYRAHSSYPYLLPEEVRTNPDGMSAEELHDAAWPLIESVLGSERSRALDRFHEVHGTGRASLEATEIVRAAANGRVEDLFVAVDPWCWEQVDSPGAVATLGSDAAFARCESLDRAVTDTLTQGGQVYAVPASEVSGGSDVAAVFRY